MSTVVISGYFNPLHRGHIDYITAAKKLGERLIVIVNNDTQQLLKKGQIIIPENDRMQIIKSLRDVDICILSIDEDATVIKTLKYLINKYGPVIFANGGDKLSDKDVPESILEGVEFIYGVGGKEKIDSSTNINELSNIASKPDITFVMKSWGFEKILVNNEFYCGKILHIKKGHCTSWHFHKIKDETFFILDGQIKLETTMPDDLILNKNDCLRLKPKRMHRLYAMEDSNIIEISTQHFDEDSIRVIESDRPDLSFVQQITFEEMSKIVLDERIQ